MALFAMVVTVTPVFAANIIHEFYVPLPEAQVKTALTSIEPGTGTIGNTIESVVSIVVTGVGTVIHYDQWEDGYEVDLNNPTQTTTQIWGDGNDANGIPPGYAHDPASFSAGAVIVLRNQIPLPRNPANLFYDGRDRFGGTKALVVSRASWATTPGTVLCGANEVNATMDYGTQFISPIGIDVSASSMFEFVGMFVMARDDGTSVTIDPDGPGSTAATTITLNRGESYLANGGIKKGATVTATKPVQAHLITGDISAGYESRRFTLYPRDQWSNTTYSPVGTASNGDASYAFLYNPNASGITINATTCTGSSSFTIAANSVYQYQLPQNCGSKFVSAGGEDFFGVVTVGANPSSNNVHDWGFAMVPSDNLTSEAVVGWGPGSGDGTQNGSPVWVTPTKATRVYVDYNGDKLGSLTDPSGGKYDAHYDLSALQTKNLYDPDKDQTAMRIYTLDGTTITAAWGQDPAVAGPALPYLDCGTTVLPFPVPVMKKTVAIITDTAPAGYSLNDVIEYTVTVDNHGLLPLGNLIVLDPLNASLSYVPNSTKRDSVLIPDDASGTPFPLDGAGYTIPIINKGGSTIFTYRTTIVGTGTITNTVNNVTYNLNAGTNVVVPTGGGSTQCGAQFTNSTGTVVTSFNAGSSVYATLTDADANHSSTAVETVTVAVNDTTSGDAEFVTLTETGVNTGIFRNLAGLPTSTTTGNSTMDGTLHVAAGDNLSFTYLDPQYSDTCTGSATIATPTQNKFLYLSTDGSDGDTSGSLDRIDPVATSDATTSSTSSLGLSLGTIAVDATTAGASASAASLTINHTTGTGSNRLMIVGVTVGSSGSTNNDVTTISSVKYGTTNLTPLGTVTDPGTRVRSSIYYLVAPPSGTLGVVITLGVARPVYAGVTTFTGVDQTTPLGSYQSSSVGNAGAGGGGANNATFTFTSATGEMLYDCLAVDGETNTLTGSAGTGQTSRWTRNTSTSLLGCAGTKPGSSSLNLAWTWSPVEAQQYGWSAVSIKPASAGGTPSATFTQTPSFASAFTLPIGATPVVTNYFTTLTGSMPASPTITAELRKNGTTFATSTSASAASGLLTFGFPALASAVNFASSDVLSLVTTTTQSGVTFTLDYDSTTKPSKITLPTTTVIKVNSLAVYDAPYPGGSIITAPTSGTTTYVRATVSDPFGNYDITSLDLNIDGPGSAGDASTTLTATVATTTGTKTFEYPWMVSSTTGSYNIIATANEGTEGIIDTTSIPVNVTFLDLGTPSTTEFTSGSNGTSTTSFAGDTQVCVRVTDLDQNTNPTLAETITAVITATSGDSELVTLTETGINTGVFVYCINASTTTGSTHDDGTLHAIVGDVLHVAYVDPTDSSDTSSATATVPPPPGVDGINVAKTLVTPADGVAVIGEALSYNVQVTNTGSTTLNTIPLTDTFNASMITFVSASTSPTTTGAGSLSWTNVGPLTPGQSHTITLNFTAAGTATPAANTASATGGTASSSSTANVTITNPHVSIAKTRTSAATANIGDNVTFRIVATNDGSSAIDSLPIEDTFSNADFEFISATIAPDATGAGSLLWLDVTGAGSLAPTSSITIDVTFKAKGAAAPATNLAAANYTVDVNGDPAPPVQSSATVTLIAAKITGTVYNDLSNNGAFNSGEPGIEGVTLTLYTDPNGDGDPGDGSVVAIVTTDANGAYEFTNLALGTYVIVESDPIGYASTGDTSGANDNRIPVNVTTLTTWSANNFFDHLPVPSDYASITGTVWNDVDANGVQNGGETGISNVTINLIQDINSNGIADSGEPVVRSTLTDSSGNYSFTSLPPGVYVVIEEDLFGWLSTADNVGANDNAIPFSVSPGDNLSGCNFLDTQLGTITGTVFQDANGNGAYDAGTDTLLTNIDVLITDSMNVTQTVTTNASGVWTASVPPGTATVDVQQSDTDFTAVFTAGYTQTAGTDPSNVTAVSNTSTSAGIDGFRQLATVTGHLYVDTNGNGTQDVGEPDLPNVNVVITNVDGGTQTVTTDSNGSWSAVVPPGNTTANVDETDTDFTALVLSGYVQTQGNDANIIVAIANTSTTSVPAGYFNPATVTGHLYVDTNGNHTQDVGEPDLANLDVLITDSLGHTQIVSTNTSGDWSASVPPGSTSADVQETDPQFPAGGQQSEGTDPTSVTAVAHSTVSAGVDGYYVPATVTGHLYIDANGNGTQDVGELNLANVDILITDSQSHTQTVTTNSSGDWTASVPPGTTSADVDESDPQFPVGSLHSEGTDPSSVTAVANSSVSAGNDGYFIPATITGHLYIDTNGNGQQDSGEPNLPNIDVVITDSLAQSQTVSTDANGDWTASVPPGSTTANVQETDPQFPAGTVHTQGDDPTTFTAVAGSSTNGGTDGYYIPATITGHLYRDTNGNGQQDSGEPNLANVDVLITDSTGATQTVSTNASGNWTAVVPPGSTSANVDENDSDFPVGAVQTEGTDPSTVTAVANATTSAGIDGYVVLAVVTGHLYIDTNGNGTQDSGEPDLVGVEVLITDTNNQTQTVTSNSSGVWSASVPPGSTSANVDETSPQFPAGSSHTEGTDPTVVTAVAGASTSAGNDGYYIATSVTGHLYVDTNGNGHQDSGEPNLANIDVIITDTLGRTETVTTDHNGDWSASVPPGSTSANVDETDPDFPAGSTRTEGTDPTTVTAVIGTVVDAGTDGFYLPAAVTGHLYIDTNGNGTQDVGEPNLPNVDVVITDSNNATHRVSTNATGDWTASVPPGSTSADVDETDTSFTALVLPGYVHSEGTDPTTFTAIAGASTSGGTDGYYNPATVTGHLYIDTNGNGTQDVGEPNLANIDVLVSDSLGHTQTVSTNSTGDWTAVVPPGSTTADVQESDPQFPAGASQTQGTDPVTFTAVAGTSTSSGNDGYYIPATIAGHLYIDINGNGTQDSGEPDLANVDVLITASTGATQTVTTNGSGNWIATVPPGSTTANVDETDPEFPAGATRTEGTDPSLFTAVANTTTDGGTDGFYIPAIITGHLYIDRNGNGTQDSGEPNLANIDVIITDVLGHTHTVATNDSGNWTATVPPGPTSVNVDETDSDFVAAVPTGYQQTEGTDPNSVTAIANTTTNAGIDGYFIPATVNGHLYVDTNGNAQQDSGEPDLANVDVVVTDSLGHTHTVATGSDGNWTASVPPGTTSANVDENDAQFPVGGVQTEGTDPTTITALAGSPVNAGNDGYMIPGIVSGHLYFDTNGDGTQNNGEPDLANINVLITDANNHTQLVQTNATGDWTALVPPGSTSVDVDESDDDFPFGATQTQGTDPVTVTAVVSTTVSAGINGYFIPAIVTGHIYLDTNGDYLQNSGEPDLENIDVIVTDSNGNSHNASTDAFGNWSASVPPGTTLVTIGTVPASYQHLEGDDPTTLEALVGQSNDGGIDGFYIPATVHGHLYVDTNGNGQQDSGEPNLANVDVEIIDSTFLTTTVSTDGNGNWTSNVPPGSTLVHVIENDPDFQSLVHFDYVQTEGVDPSSVLAIADADTNAGNDGFMNPATITGHLYIDVNGDGFQSLGETDLSNVNVVVTDTNLQQHIVHTDSNGIWTALVPPGPTTVNVDETDPDFTANIPPSYILTEGSDPHALNAVVSTTTSFGNNGYFIPSTVTGHLYLDIDGDGHQQTGEPSLANVDVIVTDSNSTPHTVTTDAQGDWTAKVPSGATTVKVQTSDPDYTALVPPGSPQTEGTDPNTVTAVTSNTVNGGTDGWTFGTGTYTISGQVRDDYDSNGNFSDNDTPVSGVTIKLWLDVNGDGQLDSGDAFLRSTITDNNGQYSFGSLASANYIVQEIDPHPATSTADKAGANDNLIPVPLAGADVASRDFLDAVDPEGYVYDSITGAIIPGGNISVNGPGAVTVLMNGSFGQYSFVTDGTVGTYTITFTPPPGYRIDSTRPPHSGAFDPTGGADPTSLGSSEDPGNHGYLISYAAIDNVYYLSFDLAAGDPLVINNNIPVVLIKPNSFTYWEAITPGAGTTPTSNNDCDYTSDLLEYALCGSATTGVQTSPLFLVQKNVATGFIDASFKRPAGTSDVSYTVQLLTNLANSPAGWTPTTLTPTIVSNGDGSETVTYANLESDPFFATSPNQGFARLKVTQLSAPSATSVTETYGWTHRLAHSVCESFSMPYLKPEVFAGCVESVTGNTITAAASAGTTSIASQFVSGQQYYVEVISGAHEGQRFEVDEAASTATSIVIATGNALNTMATVPALDGERISVRAHWLLGELFDKNVFNGTNSALTADRLLFFNHTSGGFEIYYLIASGQTRFWAHSGQTPSDQGSRIINGDEGLLIHPRYAPLPLLFTGIVRTNKFACPTPVGDSFIGSGWPMNETPTGRTFTTSNGFTGNRTPLLADRVMFWKGDTVPSDLGYTSHFLLQFGALQQWTPQGNATLLNENNLPLYTPLRASLFRSILGKPDLVMPLPWTP